MFQFWRDDVLSSRGESLRAMTAKRGFSENNMCVRLFLIVHMSRTRDKGKQLQCSHISQDVIQLKEIVPHETGIYGCKIIAESDKSFIHIFLLLVDFYF